jgi:hypothetical protein
MYVYEVYPPACLPNCGMFNHTISIPNISPNCICMNPYTWDSSTSQCVLNCSSIMYTSGQNGTHNCSCAQNYTWNGSACLPVCGNLSRTNGTNEMDARRCLCVSGYRWCVLIGQCVRQCTNFTTGMFNQTDITACVCIEGYVWFNGTCRLQCSSIPNVYSGNTTY